MNGIARRASPDVFTALGESGMKERLACVA
jgi:hypothetical protein